MSIQDSAAGRCVSCIRHGAPGRFSSAFRTRATLIVEALRPAWLDANGAPLAGHGGIRFRDTAHVVDAICSGIVMYYEAGGATPVDTLCFDWIERREAQWLSIWSWRALTYCADVDHEVALDCMADAEAERPDPRAPST